MMNAQILTIIPKRKKVKKLEFHEKMMLRYSSFYGYGKKVKEQA